MAKASPLTAGSSKTGKPMYTKAIPAMNNLKNTKSEMSIDRNKAGRAAGDMYKKPGKTGRGLVGARSDESSGQSLPEKQGKGPGCDNLRTYNAPAQNSNFNNDGPRPTKFVN